MSVISSFNTVRRIVHGAGCIEKIGEEIRRCCGSRILVITDPGIKAAGVLDMLARVLEKTGVPASYFSDVEPDPKIEVVERSLEAARAFQPDIIIGLGGGSSLDIAKVTSVLLTNDGPIEKYFGMELVPNPGLPLILIPTTAGTGSEVTSICVLSDTRNHVKKGIVSEHMYARVVLLDPELTAGLPPRITAMTGMDALVHAMESFTGVRATPFTDCLNQEAIRLIASNLRIAFANGANLQARENMLYASCIAGMAFSNTQNGLVHALALAIGGKYHLPHGLLTAFICPWVMEFNMLATPGKFIAIARSFGERTDGLPVMEAARLSVKAVKSLLDDLSISYTLKSYDIHRESFPEIAKATLSAVRLISNNPRTVTEKDVVALLEANYE
ncbi:MAG: iron-containing alcohol dehydrogenase [Nitrospiraceae bacterium]|jgi:alcohol dehydrogenase|nr:iron-containing alcohol dehydrogenase [Nitrospiraceae bacterium]